MKIKSIVSILLSILLIAMLFPSCNEEEIVDKTTLHLSPIMCGYVLQGVTPEEFCSSKGKGTFLKDKYLQAYVDDDGCLILTLKNETISEWKNTFIELQVLQCMFGDTRDIGITIDYSLDFMGFMKNAGTCGYEISEDFTKVIESPGDNSWYFSLTNAGCAVMQALEGKKTCTELKVEHITIDENGEVIDTYVFPDDVGDSSKN